MQTLCGWVPNLSGCACCQVRLRARIDSWEGRDAGRLPADVLSDPGEGVQQLLCVDGVAESLVPEEAGDSGNGCLAPVDLVLLLRFQFPSSRVGGGDSVVSIRTGSGAVSALAQDARVCRYRTDGRALFRFFYIIGCRRTVPGGSRRASSLHLVQHPLQFALVASRRDTHIVSAFQFLQTDCRLEVNAY